MPAQNRGSRSSQTSDPTLQRACQESRATAQTSACQPADQPHAAFGKIGSRESKHFNKLAGGGRLSLAEISIHQEDDVIREVSSQAPEEFESAKLTSADVITGKADTITESPDLQKSKDFATIHDIIFDEQGQTWDIYGADFDAEILGQAIEGHLENIIKKRTDGLRDSPMRGEGTVETEAVTGSDDTEVNYRPYLRQREAKSRELEAARGRGLGAIIRLLSLVTSRNDHPG